jgi:hypothetical protein
METLTSKPYGLKLDSRVEPNIGKMTIAELRELQQRKEEAEQKFDPSPETAFMVGDKDALQKVLVATLTDTVKAKTKQRGRPRKETEKKA